MERLEQQLNFILEVDKLKSITRQTSVTDGSRKENDAEHSWHLALMGILLKEYSNENINILKVMTMVLIHDIIEIDAGDTYAYDEEANKTKRAREVLAADRIFGLLPEDQALEMRALWEEFEENNTKEAKFALTLDKMQPLLLTDRAGGGDWRGHHVREEQVRERNETTPEGSRRLWDYCSQVIDRNVKSGNIIKSK